ncbi:unnamed protein product, partial [Urochloa humidicola]
VIPFLSFLPPFPIPGRKAVAPAPGPQASVSAGVRRPCPIPARARTTSHRRRPADGVPRDPGRRRRTARLEIVLRLPAHVKSHRRQVLLACILKLSGTAVAPLCAALPWSARRRAPPLLRPSPARAFPCPGRPVACSPPATRVQPLQGGELRAAVDWQPSTPPLGRPTPARARPSSARPARAAPWQLPQQLRRRRRRGRRLHRAAPIHAIAQPRSGASQFRRASSRSAAGKDGKGRRGREVVQCREEGRRGRDDEWDPRVSEKSN